MTTVVLQLHPLGNMGCTEVPNESQSSLSFTSPCEGTLPDGDRRTFMCPCVDVAWRGQFAG